MPYRDSEDKRHHNRSYAQANKESIAERHRLWYQENKERIRDQQREYRRQVRRQDAMSQIQNLNTDTDVT